MGRAAHPFERSESASGSAYWLQRAGMRRPVDYKGSMNCKATYVGFQIVCLLLPLDHELVHQNADPGDVENFVGSDNLRAEPVENILGVGGVERTMW